MAANGIEHRGALEIDAPPPGDIFRSTVEHPANVELIEGDPRARKLARNELKTLQKQAKAIQKQLEAGRYWQALDVISRHLEQARQLLIRAEDAPVQTSPILKKRAAMHHKRAQTIRHKIRRYRALAIRLDRIEKRFNEHEIALANEKLYQKLRDEMRREVHFFASQCVERWSALGFRQKVTRGNRTKTHKVQFEKCVVTEDEIQFKIRVADLSLLRSVKHHLPHGVRVSELVSEETLAELAAACQRPVTSPHHEEDKDFSNGAYIVVHRMGMNDGLFNYIRLGDVLVKYNQGERHRFPFPIGVKRGRVALFEYLDRQPHLMFNGLTGSGKTNAIRSILTTLIQYHSPQELRLFITDLKRGADFNHFHNIPHLSGEILTEVEDLERLSWQLVGLMRSRMATIAKRFQVDIQSYNASVSEENQLERVLLIVDECSAIDSLATEKKQAKSIWRALGLLATQARAAGIHLFLGTQQSFSDSIPKNVRDNITFVLSGRQRTLAGSMSTFGDGRAKKLPAIPGRMYCYNGDLFQVQTPHATFEDIQSAVKVAQTWDNPGEVLMPESVDDEGTPFHAFNPDTVIQIALEQFEGDIKAKSIWDLVGETGISYEQVKKVVQEVTSQKMIEHENQTYSIKRFKNWYRLVSA